MGINYNFFKKKDMKKFLRNQFLTGMILILVGIYFSKKKNISYSQFFSNIWIVLLLIFCA